MNKKIIIGVIIALLIIVGVYNLMKSNVEEKDMAITENSKKIAEMYIAMVNDIMSKSTALQSNINFISIDFANFRRPLTEFEKNQKETEKMIKSRQIENETKEEIIKYLKDKYQNIEIKQNNLYELQEQGLATKDSILGGILIYARGFPEFISDNEVQIELVKYKGNEGANFLKYEAHYENNTWKIDIKREAIS